MHLLSLTDHAANRLVVFSLEDRGRDRQAPGKDYVRRHRPLRAGEVAGKQIRRLQTRRLWRKDEDKWGLLKDVWSFANTQGGDILIFLNVTSYGVMTADRSSSPCRADRMNHWPLRSAYYRALLSRSEIWSSTGAGSVSFGPQHATNTTGFSSCRSTLGHAPPLPLAALTTPPSP